MKAMNALALVTVAMVCVAAVGGCEKKGEQAPPAGTGTKTPGNTPPPAKPSVEHHDGDGHDHSADGHEHGDGQGHGPEQPLGEQSVGSWKVKVTLEGTLKAGAEVALDVEVSGASRPAVVRAWIGAEDAKGSMKAKAESEKEGWHAHVEAPNPMPERSKVWVELENEKGEKSSAGFDVKS